MDDRVRMPKFWRRTWRGFVLVTFPIWWPGIVVGGILAALAADEAEIEHKKQFSRRGGDQ